jgi:hypothetical protein
MKFTIEGGPRDDTRSLHVDGFADVVILEDRTPESGHDFERICQMIEDAPQCVPFDLLKLTIELLGYPTEGRAACALWAWLSSSRGPAPSEAAAVYRELGYEPFKGYPLTRKS